MNSEKPYNFLPMLPPEFEITSEIGLKCGDTRATKIKFRY